MSEPFDLEHALDKDDFNRKEPDMSRSLDDTLAAMPVLSPDEAALMPDHKKKLRENYEHARAKTQAARDELFNAMKGMETKATLAALARMTNHFAQCNAMLWNMARAVVDYEELDDDGAAEEIKWEVLL